MTGVENQIYCLRGVENDERYCIIKMPKRHQLRIMPTSYGMMSSMMSARNPNVLTTDSLTGGPVLGSGFSITSNPLLKFMNTYFKKLLLGESGLLFGPSVIIECSGAE